MCKRAHTCGHGVGTPADLSVCPASAEPQGCPGPHLNTLPALARPHGNPRNGAGVWETWIGADRWVHVVGSPGAAREPRASEPRDRGSRKMGQCSPLPRKCPPEQEQVGAPGRWGSASSAQETHPQSRSRWEASGSPHLAVIHAGCARAFTAEQRPAPTGARRSGESSGSAGLLDLLLPSERETEAVDSLSHGLPTSLGRCGPATLYLEGVGQGRWLPASCAVWPVTRARPLLQDQAGPAPPLPSARVKSSAQLAAFPWQQQ